MAAGLVAVGHGDQVVLGTAHAERPLASAARRLVDDVLKENGRPAGLRHLFS